MAKKGSEVLAGATLLLGGLIGGGLALLFAPQATSGRRRESDGDTATIEGKANEAVYEFAESIDTFITSVEKRSGEIMENSENLTQESKEELLAALENGRQNLARLRDRLAKMIG